MTTTAQDLINRLDAAERKLDAVTKDGAGIEAKTKGYTPKASHVFGAPTARMGESILTSRGFRLVNAIDAMMRGDWSNAKVEKSLDEMMRNAFGRGVGPASFSDNARLCPLGVDLLPEEMANDRDFGVRIKSLFFAGVDGVDPEETAWLRQKMYMGGTRKDLSWLDSSAGGALVGPPERGEFIDLLRNTAALTQAGCQVIPMPPSGRIQFPKQTTPSTGYWVGENTLVTASQQGTGLTTLSAKKCAGITKVPNDLIRYAGAAAEALVRQDLTNTLQLTFDQAGIEGTGGDIKPLGIINTPGVQTVSPTTAASGNTGAVLAEGDIYKWPQQIEEANGQFEAYIMTPAMYYALLRRRVSAVTANDALGAFTFQPFRALGDAVANKNINGYKVVTSNQVPKNRVQGSSTNNTVVIGGQMSDVMLAMFGALEFALTNSGDTPFAYDQTWIRAILIGDVGIRHPGVVAWADKVQAA